MNYRQLLALLFILSMLLVPIVPPPARAAGGGFSEKLTAYVAGSDAAWFMGLGNVNVSNSYIASAESRPGVSWYNLTAIRTTSWVSDFQMFGPDGYRVLPVPFVPPQGVFLTAGAASYPDAAAAAAQFGNYLLTTFRSTSNSSGVYSFFAPLSFNSIMPSTLLRLLPSGLGGFAQAVAVSSFIGLQSPMVTLEGQRGDSGFTHTLVLGSITSSGLDSSSRPNLLGYFGPTKTSIQASGSSSSSRVVFHFLDGLVVSSDKNATVTSDSASFDSSYELHLSPGAKLYRLNATVIQQPARLLATRQVDVGVLKTGSNMSVTISFTNLSNSTSLTQISVNDDWWQGTGLFRLVGGSSNVTVATLAAGQSTSPTYVLQFTGNVTRQLSLPASSVSYSYAAGGSILSGHATLNGITVSLGADEPVVFAYLSPSGGLRHSVGDNQSLKVFVKNVGTRTASSVVVAGHQVGGLAPGGSTTIDLTTSAPSLVVTKVARSYEVSYATPEGQTVGLSTNALPVIFSHASMKVAFGVLRMNSTVAELPGGAGSRLNITLGFANQGSATLRSLSARYPLPVGLGCGTVGGTNATCSNGVVSLSYSRVLPQGHEDSWISFNVTQGRSFIFQPVAFSLSTAGYNLTGASNAQPVATGLAVTKQFNPSQLFAGMASQVTVLASNRGPYTFYNASFSTTADSFDRLSGAGTTSKSVSNLAAGTDATFSYGVSTGSASLGAQSSPVAAVFYFGGTPFRVSLSGPRVSIYQLPSASIAATPQSPTEGRDFTIRIAITNPAPVSITSVQFLLPIPQGVVLRAPVNASVSGGDLSINIGQLAGGGTYTARVNASANSGQTIPFAGAKLTFGYSGASMNGRLPSGGIAIGENVLVRYELPIALVLLALLATAFYARRMAGSISLSSRK